MSDNKRNNTSSPNNSSNQDSSDLLNCKQPDDQYDDREENALFGDQTEVGVGDVYLDICSPSTELKTGCVLDGQMDSNRPLKNVFSDASHKKSDRSDNLLSADLANAVDCCHHTVKTDESLSTVLAETESFDSCPRAIKSEEDLTIERDIRATVERDVVIPEADKLKDELVQQNKIAGNVEVVHKSQSNESVALDGDKGVLDKTIKTEGENSSLSIGKQEESSSTSVTSERKRKHTSYVSDQSDLEDMNVDLSETENQREIENKKVGAEVFEPFGNDVVVKKKRGRPRKDKSLTVESSSVIKRCPLTLRKARKNEDKSTKQIGCDKKSGMEVKNGEMSETVKIGGKFNCNDCHRAFTSSSLLKKHMLTCKQLKSTSDILTSQNGPVSRSKHQCPVCQDYFMKLDGVKRHLTCQHSNLVSITCLLCHKKVGDVNKILQHFLSQHPSEYSAKKYKDHLCTVCGVSFPKSSLLKLHFTRTHCNLLHVTCKLCQQSVERMSDYLQHFHTHHMTPDGRGSDVSVAAVLRGMKKNNKNTSQSESELVCSECNKTVANHKLLILHTLSHKIEENVTEVRQTISSKQPSDTESSDLFLTQLKDCDEFPVSFNTLSSNTSTSQSFSFLGCDLVSAFNRSLMAMTDISSVLHSGIQWSDSTCPKNKGDLSNKLNTFLALSGGITDIGKCLLLALEECQQVKEKDMFSDDDENEEAEVVTSSNLTENEINYYIKHSPVVRLKRIDYKGDSTTFVESESVDEGNLKVVKGVIGATSVELDESNDVISRDQTDLLMEADEPDISDDANKVDQMAVIRVEDKILTARVFNRPKVGMKKKHSSNRNRRKSNKYLSSHAVIHRKDNKFKCDFCNLSVRSLKGLHLHMVIHKTEEYFPCDKCKHKARTSYDLVKHRKVHESISCKICEFAAIDLNDLRSHQRQAHIKFFCQHCDYACATRSLLNQHLKRHEKKREEKEILSCELCDATFDSKRKLSYHVVRHTNKTPYSCPHCDYKCSARSSYQAHLFKHSGHRPYVCNICGADFTRSSYLKYHALTHSDVKQFECTTCGKCFKYKYNFQEHLMIHTGEKKFRCHLCNFACQRKTILDRHVAKHKASSWDVEISEKETEASYSEESD